MMAHRCSSGPPTAGVISSGTATTAEASALVTRLWPAILAVTAVGGSTHGQDLLAHRQFW
jgi:hypothetical protein